MRAVNWRIGGAGRIKCRDMGLRPRIGITSGMHGESWGPDGYKWLSYAQAIREAGGTPVHLGADTEGIPRAVIARLDGILFSGGNDVDLRFYPNPPELHGEEAVSRMQRFHMVPEPERDCWELPLMQAAMASQIPVLGICRGCQLMHVARGGRLVLDIPSEVATPINHGVHPEEHSSAIHALTIHADTLLAEILPHETVGVCNSRHHQSVQPDDLRSARVAASSPEDGIIEAIELPEHPWAVGVQWHPEYQPDAEVRAAHFPLFHALMRAAL